MLTAAKQSKVPETASSVNGATGSTSEELGMSGSVRRDGSVGGSSTVESSVNKPLGELVNLKALNIVQRVRDKLTGRDFPKEVTRAGQEFAASDKESNVNVEQQVELLIEQATSRANLCQCYIGWCPFW